jgi:fructan beta-fructosidase
MGLTKPSAADLSIHNRQPDNYLAGVGGIWKVRLMVQSRDMVMTGRYLNVPIKAGAVRRTLRIAVGGQVVRAFEVELAGAEVDYWAFTDVSAWRGCSAVLQLDSLPTTTDPEIQAHSAAHPLPDGALAVLNLSEEIVDAAELYQEALRPQFHFTTRRGWHNDPNGMLYYQGEYHLFYQLQPFSVSSFSDKSWGYAVSRDLVHWEERPIALYADHEGAKWSGSGVVDWRNVSGLQRGTEPPLLLFYTATGVSAHNHRPPAPGDYVQSIAYSNDRGHTWETYAGNPIMPNITPGNRDPLVQWHEPTQRWVMTLFVGQPESWLRAGNQVAAQIFTSVDLKQWHYASTVEGFFDCPVLLSLPLDGDETELRWVMYCADMKYKVGRFDGRTFTPETDFLVGQRGECAYAPQLFNDAPDGRRIQIAWGRTEAPGMPFSQIMLFPCDLAMKSTAAGPRMSWTPAQEIEQLYGQRIQIRGLELMAGAEPTQLARAGACELRLEIEVGDASAVELNVCGLAIVCEVSAKELTAKGYAAPLSLATGKLCLRMLADRLSVEIFAEDGLVYMPLAYVAPSLDEAITVQARGGRATVEHFECTTLNSIWPQIAPQP